VVGHSLQGRVVCAIPNHLSSLREPYDMRGSLAREDVAMKCSKCRYEITGDGMVYWKPRDGNEYVADLTQYCKKCGHEETVKVRPQAEAGSNTSAPVTICPDCGKEMGFYIVLAGESDRSNVLREPYGPTGEIIHRCQCGYKKDVK